MTVNDIKVIFYKKLDTKNFSHWVTFRDNRNHRSSKGRKGRLDFIRFFESQFGKLGQRWQYQADFHDIYHIKFNDEKDLLIFLIKFKSH